MKKNTSKQRIPKFLSKKCHFKKRKLYTNNGNAL